MIPSSRHDGAEFPGPLPTVAAVPVMKNAGPGLQSGLVLINTDPIPQGRNSCGDSTYVRSTPSATSSSTAGSSCSTPTAVVSVVPVLDNNSAGQAVDVVPLAAAAAAAQDIECGPASSTQAVPQAILRSFKWKIINYCIIPLSLPLLAVYWLLALAAAAAITFTITPSLLLAKQLYWACPFIPHIWNSDSIRGKYGVLGSWMLRLQFEGAHCMTVLGRLFTLPLRPHLPDFYILGFPKCGTTSLASYLKAHPALSGLAGMPGNEIFGKESHFFGGLLGRGTTNSALLYRSFFPTILTRWWSEAVLGVQRWMCFDACPTFACLPHVATRAKALTPNAKIIVMVRDPAAGVFSAETMLRNMGVPLTWSLKQPLKGANGEADERFQFPADADLFWQQLEKLDPSAPLPEDLPERFYLHLHSYLMAGRFADRLQPWIKEFGPDNVLLVDYKQFVAHPEETVLQVLEFVGTDTARYKFTRQQPRMVGDYKGACIDPSVAAWLNKTWFADSNAAVAAMLAGGKAPAAAWP